MKKTLKAVMAMLLLMAGALAPAHAQATDDLRMATISDVHVMSPTLLRQDGKAFTDYVNHDRKMLKESPALMNQATERLIGLHPQIVLITGDLTKDGEEVSHRYLRDNYLSRLRKAGIRVFVVPGNHDVDNPHAVEFLGDTTRRVHSVTKEEFAQIYKDYGYGEAIARDPHSLSYVVQLAPKTRLLCLDACEYENNDYAKNICVTHGRLKPETVEFIKQQAADARGKGMRVLAMMHHGIVQHWTWQEKAMSEYLVDDWRKMADMMQKAGIEVVFTGHFHAQDIARRGRLYDVETGSLVSYPSPIRTVDIKGHTMTIHTRLLDATGLNLPAGETLQQYGAKFALSGIQTIVGEMLPAKIQGQLKHDICDVIGHAYVAHLGGDETFTDADRQSIKAVSARLKKVSWKYNFIFKHVARYLWTDLEPQDNNLTITLQH